MLVKKSESLLQITVSGLTKFGGKLRELNDNVQMFRVWDADVKVMHKIGHT